MRIIRNRRNSSEYSSKISDSSTLRSDNPTAENYTISSLDPFNAVENNSSSTNRTLRQESGNSSASDSPFGNQIENQEEEEEEGGGDNMITGLISALLGGLSRPDGSIDVEAITGLLGSLSMQNPDGSYNFMGLTDLIRGFFGGGDGGGGSDIGSFLGGLVGALLQGFANPPGAKGVGKFTGSVVGTLLPSLSAMPPKEDGEPQGGIDPLGFAGGFIKTFFNTSSASSAPANSTQGREGGKSKYSIFKAIVSTITSIFTSSSGSSSSCMPTMLC
ncbi:hypothetical protein WA026_009665 [Henosepilachna vigintioctopunctata]|uniref:Uncharacterized protein n=1 Tax=Henosepilachna vigintioctopunctata TaxID=420089 RepID=A0AAW1U4H8_9CUCU